MFRILYGSDFHGSDLVFRKFIRAALTYKCQAAIVGGDITGKAIVPIIRRGNGSYEAQLLGERHVASTPEELARLRRTIGNMGMYALELEPNEADLLAQDAARLDQTFDELMKRKLQEWIQLAREHLEPAGIALYLMPGNDDTPAIDEVIARSGFARNPDGQRLWLNEDHELVGLANANMTPWQCPRDADEMTLSSKLAGLLGQVERPEQAVFVFHVPPYNSGLDLAPELDRELRIVHAGGQVLMKPVGSTAVREAIERAQPLLSLHGHIHESPGFRKIGRTLCVNVGSEYAEGILKAAVINLERDRVKGYLPISA